MSSILNIHTSFNYIKINMNYINLELCTTSETCYANDGIFNCVIILNSSYLFYKTTNYDNLVK